MGERRRITNKSVIKQKSMKKRSYSLIYAPNKSELFWPSSGYVPNLSFLLYKYLYIKHYFKDAVFIKLVKNSNSSNPLVLWERN